MGLILVGVISVAFYIAKTAFPDFIIGIAETTQIVAFGNYVDSHLWSKYLFSFVISYVELAKDWISDKDVGDGKTLKYYMCVVCE